MKMVIKFLFILGLFSLASCSDELGKKDETPKVQSFANDFFASEVIPTDEANKYLVSIRWRQAGIPLLITNLENKKRANVSEESSEFTEVVEGGKNYKYKVELRNAANSSGEADVVLEVHVPYDFVLSGERTLTGDLIVSSERIFVRSNTLMKSKRHQIVLKAKEFIAEGGTFQNYGSGERDCPSGTDGMVGGNITIDAEAASGTLNVIMKGADACGIDRRTAAGGHGGAGGKLTVRTKQGQSLLLNLNFSSSLPVIPKIGPWGSKGDMPTSCIALLGEASCDQ